MVENVVEKDSPGLRVVVIIVSVNECISSSPLPIPIVFNRSDGSNGLLPRPQSVLSERDIIFLRERLDAERVVDPLLDLLGNGVNQRSQFRIIIGIRHAENVLHSCEVGCCCAGRHFTSLPLVFQGRKFESSGRRGRGVLYGGTNPSGRETGERCISPRPPGWFSPC